MEADKVYLEDQNIMIPIIVDGPTSIGDLWDCQTSSCIGVNLFQKKLDSQHLQAVALKELKYTLTHNKRASDRQKSFQLSGEIALEVLAGLIKVDGRGEYENNEQSSSSEEELVYHYDLKTFSVTTLPSAKELIDQEVRDKITRGDIRATHVVMKTILGAEVTASIRIKEMKSSKQDTSKLFQKFVLGSLPLTKFDLGSFPLTKFVLGSLPLTKVALEKLDTSQSENFEKKIIVDSKPFLNSQPVTISEMFQCMEGMSKRVEEEKYPGFSSSIDSSVSNVFGVPLKFFLVPITHFLQVPIERRYVKIKDDVIENIRYILETLTGFQMPGHLKKRILQSEPHLKSILLDQNNPLALKISKRENEIRIMAKECYFNFAKTLKGYKMGKFDQNYLLKIANETNEKINITEVLQEIQEFTSEGQKEILAIHDIDINNTHQLRIFTNKMDMREWYQTQKPIKILFQTGGSCLDNGRVRCLYDISGNLKDIGAEVGITTPGISDGHHVLSIKINDKEKIYSADEISHVIRILLLLVNQADQTSTRLFTMYAYLNRIELPFQKHLTDLHSMIHVLSDLKQLKTADTFLKLREFALVKDGRWKVILDLNAFDSAFESVKQYWSLSIQLSDQTVDWIVGNYGFESPTAYSNGPLLVVLKDEKLQAICFDNIDILLLIEALKPKGDHILNLLYPDQTMLEKSCLYKTRADFALKIVQLFCRNQNIMDDEPTTSRTEAFSVVMNKRVEAIQILVRSFVGNDETALWGAMANVMLQSVPNTKTILKSHSWAEDENDFPKCVNVQQLIADLKEFVSQKDLLYAKVQTACDSVNYFHTSEKKMPEEIQECINSVINEADCPEKLRELLINSRDIQDNSCRFKKVEQILRQHLETMHKSKYETVVLFIKLLEIPVECIEDFFPTELLPKLKAWLDSDKLQHTSFQENVMKLIQTGNYYKVLHELAQLQYSENPLIMGWKQLESLTSITNTEPLCQLIHRLAESKLTVSQYQWLFSNPKFVFLLKTNSTCSKLLQTIRMFHCLTLPIPDYIPDFLRENLQTMMENDMVECPEIINTTEQAISVFQRIALNGCVPDNFFKVLSESVSKNSELKRDLKKANALFSWSDEDQLFTEAWNCETISTACNHLISWTNNVNCTEVDNTASKPRFDIDTYSHPAMQMDCCSFSEKLKQNNSDEGFITQTRRTLIGSYTETIEYRDFLMIEDILAEPCRKSFSTRGYLQNLLPYVIQRLKMWGVHVIKQEELAKLNNESVSVSKKIQFKKLVFESDVSQSQTPTGELMTANNPIAKTDILTCLNAICHIVVFQDILRIMALFPVALPFVLQDLRKERREYVCLEPLLKNTFVKWESQPGVLIHNQLFINPFRMIVALRVGAVRSGSPGKSTVLNQIMRTEHMFSSFGSPGSDKGAPLTIHGSVELAVLLQETCSSALWSSVVKRHYSTNSKEVLMLANVHGDALELQDTVKFLKGIATSFIAFFMPCTRIELQGRHGKLQEMLDDTEDIVHILVDPTQDCDSLPSLRINTNELTLDNTLETVRTALGFAIDTDCPKPSKLSFSSVSSIRLSPAIFTEKSKWMLDDIQKRGCAKTRKLLKLQKINPKLNSNFTQVAQDYWIDKSKFRSIINQVTDILNYPIENRLVAFAHLDRELSLYTANESVQIREKLRKYQEQKRRNLNLEAGGTILSDQKAIIEHIRCTLDDLDAVSLGMEHLYRELGRLYQAALCNDIPENKGILSLPKKYAELFISGHAIEILDGDIGDMSYPWFNSICHSVCESHKDLRVFTISIIGLQSSGKSTLLNALFACKFAVSVGRCTRGLFMRLIFLDKSLAKELSVDAILLIDTEGLGAPEKLNDREADKKDRLLATFAMSVSNLTLINVLGESIRDLTDILQIVIVTMARLEKADISPDILMVQHLTERDSSKTSKGADEFCKALEEAVTLTDKEGMAIGVRNCKSLSKLASRIKNGQIFKQFRPFKNGASANAPPSQEYHEDVVDLYKTILDSCKQFTNPQKFHKWHELIQCYWEAVSTEDFSLRFKNIQEVHEFIDRGNAIAKSKEALEEAFRSHRESFATTLRQFISELANKPEETRNWEMEKAKELQSIKEDLQLIPHACQSQCSKCSEATKLKNQLFMDIEGKNSQEETENTIQTHIKKTQDAVAKHLSQMTEAIWVKLGHTREFNTIIETMLKKFEVEPNPCESGRKQMEEEVWTQLQRQISEKLQVAPARRMIFREIQEEYQQNNDIVQHFVTEMATIEYPALEHTNAYDSKKKKKWKTTAKQILNKKDVADRKSHTELDSNQLNFLTSKLDELPTCLLRKSATDHFETGMVRKLRDDISKVLEDSEIKYLQGGKFQQKFKCEVHIYALVKFIDVMDAKQEEWDCKYNPRCILIQNEHMYRQKIHTRLKHGFGFEAEGRIIGDLLLKAIRKCGLQERSKAHIQNVRSLSWLRSIEHVRLYYFSHLAEEVQSGKKDRALQHFKEPKYMIETWFKEQVDSVSPEVGNKKFMETVDSELQQVIKKIQKQKNCKGIKEVVCDYLIQVAQMEYNPDEVDLDLGNSTEFGLLKTALLKKLDDEAWWLKLPPPIIVPSTRSEITKLLGCTAHCPWCGSLCWGQTDHEENADSTQKHYTCHQPRGLTGASLRYWNELLYNSCDNIKDTLIVYWNNCEKGMKWSEAKLCNDFVNWTFNAHNKSEFNELMKWFFCQLQKDIAYSTHQKPIGKYGSWMSNFKSLPSLDHILATIKARF